MARSRQAVDPHAEADIDHVVSAAEDDGGGARDGAARSPKASSWLSSAKSRASSIHPGRRRRPPPRASAPGLPPRPGIPRTRSCPESRSTERPRTRGYVPRRLWPRHGLLFEHERNARPSSTRRRRALRAPARRARRTTSGRTGDRDRNKRRKPMDGRFRSTRSRDVQSAGPGRGATAALSCAPPGKSASGLGAPLCTPAWYRLPRWMVSGHPAPMRPRMMSISYEPGVADVLEAVRPSTIAPK